MEEYLIIDVSESNKGKEQIIINKNYQIFITGTYAKELDSSYTTSFAILKNKEQEIYKILFEKLKKKKNTNTLKNDNNIFIYYKAISNLPFINPEYIFDIYVIIKIKSIKNNYCQFLKFLKYFYKIYLVGYNIKIWNYYNNMEHMTNNASESLNNYLNNLFPTKLSYYELIDKLNELEHLSYYDYQRKIRGIWKIKKKSNK
ncbi:hypothetical protein U3516DRAFT_757661 [Neocallimastix sp. 'constans']